jgi:hypothetical protein
MYKLVYNGKSRMTEVNGIRRFLSGENESWIGLFERVICESDDKEFLVELAIQEVNDYYERLHIQYDSIHYGLVEDGPA